MSGEIVAESVIAPWPPSLNVQIEDTCFQENLGGDYQRGKVFVATDIYTANLTQCHIELLERFQVRANLVVPILLNETNALWGLLIAHQCSAPRQWHETDIQLLHQLSIHLSLALQQAELYQNLQTMNSLLEEKVQERTKRLQLKKKVLEEIHDAVVTTDLNGTILSWNHGAEKNYSYTENEVLGRNIAFMYEDFDALQAEVIAPLLEKGRHAAEVVILSKSGERIDVSLHLSVVKDEQGNITHLIGCANNISDRKRAEQELQQINEELENRVEQRTTELRESEQRFASLTAAAPVGIFRMNQNNECIYVNEFWSQITGRASDVALGYGWMKTIHPDDQDQVRQRWTQVIAQRSPYQGEGRCVRPDGTNVFFYCQALPEIDEDGNFIGYIGTLTDISDRKKAEAELQQKNIELEELVQLREEALTLREDMSNMIVHDLRNPLSAILLSAEIIQRYGDRPDQQALMAKKAEQILKSGNRLKAMIDSLLLMAKLESGKILFNPVPTRPVRNIISSLKCLHHKQYKEYNLFLMSHSFSSELN